MLIIIRKQQIFNSLTIPKGPINIRKQVFLMQLNEGCICGFQRLFTQILILNKLEVWPSFSAIIFIVTPEN